MNRLRWMVFGAALPALGVACAYPDFMFGGTGGAGGNGAGGEVSSATASDSASTSVGASSTHASSSHASSSSSGSPCDVQHPAGGTCEYLPGITCGCTGSKKCSVSNETTGTSACVFAGSTPNFGRCSTDSDCLAGAWCNHATSACQPICVNNQDCASGGLCQQAFKADGTTPIPDLKVCAAHCDLVTAKPCGAGLSCIYFDSDKEFDCYNSLNVQEGDPCGVDTDCGPGLWCSNNSATCIPWCSPATASGHSGAAGCSTFQDCYSFSPAIKSGTTEYGFCF